MTTLTKSESMIQVFGQWDDFQSTHLMYVHIYVCILYQEILCIFEISRKTIKEKIREHLESIRHFLRGHGGSALLFSLVFVTF